MPYSSKSKQFGIEALVCMTGFFIHFNFHFCFVWKSKVILLCPCIIFRDVIGMKRTKKTHTRTHAHNEHQKIFCIESCSLSIFCGCYCKRIAKKELGSQWFFSISSNLNRFALGVYSVCFIWIRSSGGSERISTSKHLFKQQRILIKNKKNDSQTDRPDKST